MNRRSFVARLGSAALLSGLTGSRLAGAAQAAGRRYEPTRFASPRGAGSHDGSRGNEWTLAEAYARAAAGDRVQFAPGSYVVQSGANRTAAFTPANSGAAGKPIVFFAEHPAVYNRTRPDLHTTWVSDFTVHGLGSVTGHADRASGGRHVVWDGLSLRQVNGAWNSGELGVVSLFAGGPLHVKFLRCLFDQQGQGQLEPQNNWGAFFIQQSSAIEIADCVFANIPGSKGDENAMPIVTYATGELEIHHCEFLNNNGGSVFLKGVQQGSSHDNRPVRLHHCRHSGYSGLTIGFGAVGQGDLQAGRFCDVFQNVFHAAPDGLGISIWWRDVSGGQAPRNIRMVNNTFAGPIPFSGGEEALHRVLTVTDNDDIWRDSMFMNNIVQAEGRDIGYIGVQYGQNTAAAFKKLRSDYNCFNAPFRHYAGMSFGDWRKIGQDVHSHVGNPRLRDARGGDLRLDGNSPVRAGGNNPGLDVLDLQGRGPTTAINMGAYIAADGGDTIGIRDQQTTDALPLTWTWPYA